MSNFEEKVQNQVFEIKKIKTLFRCKNEGCSSKFKEKGNLITHIRIHVNTQIIIDGRTTIQM